MADRRARSVVVAALACSGLVVAGQLPITGAAAAPTCFGRAVTIMGTAGDDDLRGSADTSDVIWGGGGNDILVGGDFYDEGAAPDLVCGGPGDDRVEGSPGDDRLSGGRGADRVDGGNGADLELGNAGNDRVGRGSFADADSSDDVSRGGPGKDLVFGAYGQDTLLGNRGADQLFDTECDGPTLLDGGPGDDQLESWTSSFEGGTEPCDTTVDRVVGGRGDDQAKVDAPDRVTSVEALTRVVQ